MNVLEALGELFERFVFGMEYFVKGGSLVLPIAFILLGTRDLARKLAAYRRKEIAARQLIFPIGLTFLILGALALTVSSIKAYCNLRPRPHSVVEQDEGFFPLYETGFSKMISMGQHPLFVLYVISIETQSLSDPELNPVVLRLDAIKGGEIIGSRLIHGDTFINQAESEPGLNHRYTVASINSKSMSSSSETYFKLREPCMYRLTVVQPCEQYEYITSELRTVRCY